MESGEAGRSRESIEWTDAHFRALLESAPDATVISDTDGTILLVNRQVERLFGFPRDELVGEPIETLVPERMRDRHVAQRERYAEHPAVRPMGAGASLLGRRRDGAEFPVEISLSPIRTTAGTLIAAAIRDATERIRTEDELRRARDEFEARVNERTAELELRARRQQRIAEFGERIIATRGVGIVCDEAVALLSEMLELELCKVLEFVPSRDALFLRSGVGWDDGLVGVASVGIDRDSQAGFTLLSERPVVVSDLRTEERFGGPPLLQEHGVVSGMSVIIHGHHQPFGVLGVHTRDERDFSDDDVTFLQSVANLLGEAIGRHGAEGALAEARRMAQQRERLADVGAIVAKVVHDFGNSLTGLSMQAQLIQRRAEQGKPMESIAEAAELVVDQTKQLDRLVREFRDFSRDQRLDAEPLDFGRLLESVALVWRPFAQERKVEIDLTYPRDLSPLVGDEVKLRRVFDNLVKNAVEAIDAGPGLVSLDVTVPQPDTVLVSVEDTGPGIRASVDVFRMFETTKPDGSGLGLAVCKQIVMAHGGGIEFTPVRPHGTVFHVELPVRGPAVFGDHRIRRGPTAD